MAWPSPKACLELLQFIPWGLLWGTICRHYGYFRLVNESAGTLTTVSTQLKRKHDEFEENMESAESVKKRRVCPVDDNWLKEVDKVLSEVVQILQQLDGGNGSWLRRYRLGRRVAKLTKVVKSLLGRESWEVVNLQRQPTMQRMQVPGETEQQSSFMETLQQATEFISNEEISILCICGKPGVGKTTLMKGIYNKFIQTPDFHVVIWVHVSKALSLEIIQDEIGKKLALQFGKNDSIEKKRFTLYVGLRKLRYMIIFDDVWQAFSLVQVGIPKPDKQNRCKIIIASCSITMSNAMKAHSEIKMTGLSDEESWRLFCSKTGDVVLPPKIQLIAKELVKRCCGLPLKIEILGLTMCKMNQKEHWEMILTLWKLTSDHESDHATEILGSSLSTGREEDISVHDIQPLPHQFRGREEDAIVHHVPSLSQSLLNERGEEDELVHDISSRPLPSLSGGGEGASTHDIQPFSASLSWQRGG